jgi:6-phosphofructokinase
MPTDPGSEKKGDHIRRAAIIFSAANAVISSAAISFLEDDRQVVGFFHGYSNLQDYDAVTHRLLPDIHYRAFTERDLRGLRNSRGIIIGTARANPGKGIETEADLDDPQKTARLRNVYNALVDLDFTFGFFTAVDVMAKELQNLRADALATGSYFIVETMGRKAGWLSYGVGIAGEANLIIGLEDVDESIGVMEESKDEQGNTKAERKLNVDALVDKIVNLIVTRERREKHYGTVVLAEGLSSLLPESFLKNLPRDEHGHLSLGRIHLSSLISQMVADRYHARTGRRKKLTGVQLGYESRCAPPHAFDVMLGSQLGIGAYRALVEENLDGHMVSAGGQLDLTYVPFKDLINPNNLKTDIRYIRPGSDFHRLARFLETRTDKIADWSPGRRPEE